MQKAINILALVLFSTKIFACLNLYVINERGQVGIFDHYPPYDILAIENPKSYLNELKWYSKQIPKLQGKEKYQYVSNYAFYLIRLGRYKEAISILQVLNQSNNHEYYILSNLGTAHELNGNLDSALLYLTESLKVNPHSHGSSEWFHIRYIEAAIEVRDKKTNIENLDILKLDTSTSLEIGYQIGVQLKERVPLTNSPNSLLSKAIEESADYFKKNISIDWSVKFYAIALAYASEDVPIKRISKKIEETIKRILVLNKTKPNTERMDVVRRELIKETRMNYLEKDIKKWKNYKALNIDNIEILKF